MAKVYLSLGSNIGKRKTNLNKACGFLEEAGIIIHNKSSFYETQPVSEIKQRNFINQCIEVLCEFSPEKLLKTVKMIEKQMGRKKHPNPRGKNYLPRIIDIDILFYGNEIIDRPNLKIPHPGLHERRFVLEPMLEIAPHFLHPKLNKTIDELFTNCKDKSIVDMLN